MKPLFILILMVFTSCNWVFAQTSGNNSFEIKGKLSGRSNGVLKLSYLNSDGKYVTDTAVVKDGNFIFKGSIKQVHRATLKGNTTSNSVDDPNFLHVFLEPVKMEIRLQENDFKKALITGSALNEEMRRLNTSKAAIKKEQDRLDIEMDKVNGDKRDALRKIYLVYRDKERLADYAYILQHPDSKLSPYLMTYYFESRKLSLDSAEIFYKGFSKNVQESYFGDNISKLISARKAAAPGSLASDFERTTIEGKPINLALFKGKNYVLLDFWASWCVPCREENPQIKKLYEAYHPKGLEIISISWDTKENLWKSAIEADGTGKWHHIIADMYAPDDFSMREKYAIASIPTLILIDKTGKIIGRYRGSIEEGSMEELDKMLKSRL